MSGYADTGFICSLYAPDAHTARAIRRMRRTPLPLPVIWLHQLEFRNALRLRVFRGEIARPQRDASLNAFLGDIAHGVWRPVQAPVEEITREAEWLSSLYSEKLGTRSLDIIHVAAAVVLGAREFLSFDRRQNRLASKAGLKLPRL